MITIRTHCGTKTIEWKIELSWEMRKELHRIDAVRVWTPPGGEQTLVVDTHPVLEIVVPEAIAGWTGENASPTAEWVWQLPQVHLEQLAVAVGAYVYTGIEPGASSPAGDERPLVEQGGSSAPATASTPPPAASEADATPSPTTPPANAG